MKIGLSGRSVVFAIFTGSDRQGPMLTERQVGYRGAFGMIWYEAARLDFAVSKRRDKGHDPSDRPGDAVAALRQLVELADQLGYQGRRA